MADWSTPTLSSLYTDFLSYMKDRDVDIAKQFDGTTSTNVPTGAIRWDSTANRWKKWDGSVWQELTTSYQLNSLTLPNGTANGVAYLNGSKVLTTGSALTFDGSNLTTSQADGYNGLRISNTSGKIRVSGYLNGTAGAYIDALNAAESAYSMLTTNGNPLVYHVNGSEQMRLTSTGLGIGTSSPSEKLTVAGNISTGANSTIKSSSGYLLVQGYTNTIIDASNGSLYLRTGSTDKAIIDSSGNLGLGVTPSAWGSGWKAVEFGSAGSSVFSATAGNNSWFTANAYFNGANWIRPYAAPSSAYNLSSGMHSWHLAATGSAGGSLSFTQAMTLDASGNLAVGSTSAYSSSARLTLSRSTGCDVVLRDPGNAVDLGLSVVGSGGSLGTITNHPLTFYTNSVERMRIDSSGNVGIGTSTITQKLTVVDTNPVTANFKSDSTSGAGIYLDNSGRSSGYKFGILVGNIANGVFSIKDETNNATRMCIDSSGNLLVGTTGASPFDSCKVAVDASAEGFRIRSGAGQPFRFLAAGTSTTVGSITTTGSSTSYSTSSDYRLKENIQPMQNALGVVAQLNPVTYRWKADGSDGQGFIAHELQAVVPDCVTGEKDAVDAEGEPVYQGIDTSFLVATLTKAIQEQQEQINQLKAEVAALKS
jgi:hypothetical protein